MIIDFNYDRLDKQIVLNYDIMSKDIDSTESIKTPEKLIVGDGNGNGFIFIKHIDRSVTFEYHPMDPIRSSTGTYSGGQPLFKNLPSSEWTKLMNVFQTGKIQANQNEERRKGVLQLTYESDNLSDSFIVGYPSELNKQLTDFFHEYRN